MKARVLIEVLGGVAEVSGATGEVEVIIVDHDNLKAGDDLDTGPENFPIVTEPYFKKRLAAIAAEYKGKRMADKIDGYDRDDIGPSPDF